MEKSDIGTQGLVQELKSRILSGEYALGRQLIEMDIAAEFGVGRGRTREAFRTLVGEGYLEFIENRGVFVRRYTREEVLSIGRAREVMEGLAARLAAECALTGEQAEQLRQTQSDLDAAEAEGDIETFNELNRAYHRLIVRIADNPLVTEVIERVRMPLVRIQLPTSFATDSLAQSNLDHRVITAAILHGSADAAEAAMRQHVRNGNEHIASLAEDLFS